MGKLLLVVAWVVFTAYTSWVAWHHGVLGFLTLAGREPWALQLLLDLCVSLAIVAAWIRKDARRLGIASAPYIVALVLFGSIGSLGYLVRRSFARERA